MDALREEWSKRFEEARSGQERSQPECPQFDCEALITKYEIRAIIQSSHSALEAINQELALPAPDPAFYSRFLEESSVQPQAAPAASAASSVPLLEDVLTQCLAADKSRSADQSICHKRSHRKQRRASGF